ncbi:MAG TPA: TIR domain-containing protein [Opitutaceae bacterium]|jgi:TolB-like protein/Tfp pilus assembly protein PilF
MSGAANKAVFLSYAREDADAARRIAGALRGFGVDAWFDMAELRGGDAWDRKIRSQIRECALFIPIISANTQNREEGYFRREWNLAVERTLDMAEDRTFIVPVVVDATIESAARVPESFLKAHCTRLPGGEPTPQFVERIRSLLNGPRKTAAGGAPPAASVSPKAKSVAVLAFANLSRDPENEFFSDGISEELLNLVARIPGLRVAARTSAFFFKGKNVPIPEIAATLGVANVVEGSVRKSGNRVRVTAKLIDAGDGFQIWSESFDRELQDVFAIQDEIAGLIAHSLQLKLGDAARPARAVNPEAHRYVLEGRHFWSLRSETGFARAEDAFARALEIDPDFAPAHAGLADVWAVRAWYGAAAGTSEARHLLERATVAAQRAIELNPSESGAYAAMAVVSFLEHRFEDSERQFQQAFRLNPNYAVAYHWHAHLLAARGRLDESLAELERSITLDPLSTVTLVIYASHLVLARRYDEALGITDRALELQCTLMAPINGARAMSLLALGRGAEAAAAARKVRQVESLLMRWWAGEEALYVLLHAGAPGEAAKQYGEWKDAAPADSVDFGHLLNALGRFDEALPYLETTATANFARLYFHPVWDAVRDDPRFSNLLKRLGCEAEYAVGRATIGRMLLGREKSLPQ